MRGFWKWMILAVWLVCFQAYGQNTKAPSKSPWTGTWTLDAAASKFGPHPLPNLKLEIAQADNSFVKWAASSPDANGTVSTETWEGKPDGTPHPVLFEGKEIAQASYTWPSAEMLRGEAISPNGKSETITFQLTPDGRSLTLSRHVKRSDGGFDEVLLFRR